MHTHTHIETHINYAQNRSCRDKGLSCVSHEKEPLATCQSRYDVSEFAVNDDNRFCRTVLHNLLLSNNSPIANV